MHTVARFSWKLDFLLWLSPSCVCECHCWWCVPVFQRSQIWECECGVQKWARVFVRLEAAPDVQFALQLGLNELLDHRFTLTGSLRGRERDSGKSISAHKVWWLLLACLVLPKQWKIRKICSKKIWIPFKWNDKLLYIQMKIFSCCEVKCARCVRVNYVSDLPDSYSEFYIQIQKYILRWSCWKNMKRRPYFFKECQEALAKRNPPFKENDQGYSTQSKALRKCSSQKKYKE